jgi:ribonuclease P protein component
MAPTGFTFSKNERLSSRKIIGQLFEKGKSIVVVPFRLSFIQTPLPSVSPAQIAFSVPVKNFRKAVDRNRIKRQMREVYRKNKSSVYALLESQKVQCAMMIVFMGKAKPSFEEVEQKLKLTLHRFEEEFKKHAE